MNNTPSEVRAEFLSPFFFLFLAIIGFVVALWRLRDRRRLSRGKVIAWGSLGVLSLLPLLGIGFLLGWFAVANFPFTSGVIAHRTSPDGTEVCVVQTFKGAEPYQVSLYAHRRSEPWRWHYLAHQDNRWRNCRIEFSGDELRVYAGSTLQRTFSVAAAVTTSASDSHDAPANYTPEQILAQHNAYFKN